MAQIFLDMMDEELTRDDLNMDDLKAFAQKVKADNLTKLKQLNMITRYHNRLQLIESNKEDNKEDMRKTADELYQQDLYDVVTIYDTDSKTTELNMRYIDVPSKDEYEILALDTQYQICLNEMILRVIYHHRSVDQVKVNYEERRAKKQDLVFKALEEVVSGCFEPSNQSVSSWVKNKILNSK